MLATTVFQTIYEQMHKIPITRRQESFPTLASLLTDEMLAQLAARLPRGRKRRLPLELAAVTTSMAGMAGVGLYETHLNHGLERTQGRCRQACPKAKGVKAGLEPCSHDDAAHHEHERGVGGDRLLPALHDKRKERSEEGCARADGLVERHRDVTERDVAAHQRGREHRREQPDLEELLRTVEWLEEDQAASCCACREQRACHHVQQRERDGVAKVERREQILVCNDQGGVDEVPAHSPAGLCCTTAQRRQRFGATRAHMIFFGSVDAAQDKWRTMLPQRKRGA